MQYELCPSPRACIGGMIGCANDAAVTRFTRTAKYWPGCRQGHNWSYSTLSKGFSSGQVFGGRSGNSGQGRARQTWTTSQCFSSRLETVLCSVRQATWGPIASHTLNRIANSEANFGRREFYVVVRHMSAESYVSHVLWRMYMTYALRCRAT